MKIIQKSAALFNPLIATLITLANEYRLTVNELILTFTALGSLVASKAVLPYAQSRNVQSTVTEHFIASKKHRLPRSFFIVISHVLL
jgi:hypothetical protein